MARVNLKSKEVWLVDAGESKKPSYLLRVTHVGYEIHYSGKDGAVRIVCANHSDLKDLDRQTDRIIKYGGKVLETKRMPVERYIVRIYDPYHKRVLRYTTAQNASYENLIQGGRTMREELERSVSHREYEYIKPKPYMRSGKRGSFSEK